MGRTQVQELGAAATPPSSILSQAPKLQDGMVYSEGVLIDPALSPTTTVQVTNT